MTTFKNFVLQLFFGHIREPTHMLKAPSPEVCASGPKMPRRWNANRGSLRANWFARIDSQKNPYFHNVRAIRANLKNLLTPLFLMGCFPVDFQEVKRPLRTKSVKRPIKVGKRPINEGKRPIKAMVLVGVSVGCLMGCFRAPPPWQKTAPLKRPIKRSMRIASNLRFASSYPKDLAILNTTTY